MCTLKYFKGVFSARMLFEFFILRKIFRRFNVENKVIRVRLCISFYGIEFDFIENLLHLNVLLNAFYVIVLIDHP